MRAILVPLALLAAAAQPAHAADPVLRRVTLSSGGMGQFEFSAQAVGAETLTLDVPLDQVDDLLKSLRVDDPAGAPAIRLPGRQPLAESFRTLPFGPDALRSPQALLGALVGESVRVAGPGIAGVILSVTEFETQLADRSGTLTRHRLTIATQAGIESVVLEDAQGIEFASDGLRAQIATALAAIAGQRVQDRRRLTVTLAPGGPRPVRLGYVVAAPVWKASYRMTVPAGNGPAEARLQGFAIVENLSGRDWRDVEVVLTAGQPVLYRQALYDAVFATRPEAPVEISGRLTPQLDLGAMPPAPPAERRARLLPAPAPGRPAPAASLSAMAPASEPESLPEATPQQPGLSQLRQSAAQVEFRLAAPVTAAAGESLMLPIVGRDVPARRVALYQPETDPLHPLVALLVRNDLPGALPPGLATLYERGPDGATAFIGDARLPTIQPGEERLASFAADLAVRIDTVRGNDATVTGGSAASGLLTLVRRERATTTYRVTTPPGSGRTVMLEQPRRQGWAVVQPTDAAATPTHYRVIRDVPAGETASIEIVLERPRSERIVLSDADPTTLAAFANEGQLPPSLRAALSRGADLRRALDQANSALRTLQDRTARIVTDQGRIRQNLAAVPTNSELARRYLSTLQQQETELAALLTQSEAAQRAVTEAEGTWKAYVQALTL